MNDFVPDFSKLYVPDLNSHKGQNGKLLVIGGSCLFHAASLWALQIASKIVDMVYFSSVDENNQIVLDLKKEFRNGIVVPRGRVEEYIPDADCILIGPGLPRKEGEEEGDDDTKELTERLLKKYLHKKWVIDGGSLQTIDPSVIPKNAILTPHQREFEMLFGVTRDTRHVTRTENVLPVTFDVLPFAKEHNCTILLKGPVDTVCSPTKCVQIAGGSAGMTKGGTGDVLAGLVAALYCKNDAFFSATMGSFLNKKAGESLEKRMGTYFNSSDLVEEIPKIMKEYTG